MKAIYQMHVLLAAEEVAGVQALRLLSNSGHILAGVLTTVNSPDADEHQNDSDEIAGPNRKPPNSSIASIARSLGVPVLDARRVQEPGFAAWMERRPLLQRIIGYWLIDVRWMARPLLPLLS